jgi:hypothetical protein
MIGLFDGGTPTLQDLPDDQRDEPAIGRGVALLQALYAGLAGRRSGPAEACSVACGRGLLGLSALSLATVYHARPSGLVGGSPLRYSLMRERRSGPVPIPPEAFRTLG